MSCERISSPAKKYVEKARGKWKNISTALFFLSLHLTATNYYLDHDFNHKRPPRVNSHTDIIPGKATYTRTVYSQPESIVAHTIKISDIRDFEILMDTSHKDPEMEGSARTVVDFIQSTDAVIVINGSFFHPFRSGLVGKYPNRGDDINIYGQVIHNGEEISPPEIGFSVLCKDHEGKITIMEFECGQDTADAIAGKEKLISDGNVLSGLDDTKKHPRTAVGVDGTGYGLILLIVDGRQPNYSEGFTLKQLAETLVKLGAEEALELDGGWSSTGVIRLIDGVYVVNHPNDDSIPGKLRDVFAFGFAEAKK